MIVYTFYLHTAFPTVCVVTLISKVIFIPFCLYASMFLSAGGMNLPACKHLLASSIGVLCLILQLLPKRNMSLAGIQSPIYMGAPYIS